MACQAAGDAFLKRSWAIVVAVLGLLLPSAAYGLSCARPSLAVPVQVVDGPPQAVQLIARRFHEDLCFDAAELIERQQGVFTPIEPREGARKV